MLSKEFGMAIQRLGKGDIAILRKPRIASAQLVWPRDAPDALATVTRVTMAPGSVSHRHAHPHSEQIWIVEHGAGSLLMEAGTSARVEAGDIVRTPPGDVHGIENTGSTPLVYLAITTPPQDFRAAYEDEGRATDQPRCGSDAATSGPYPRPNPETVAGRDANRASRPVRRNPAGP